MTTRCPYPRCVLEEHETGEHKFVRPEKPYGALRFLQQLSGMQSNSPRCDQGEPSDPGVAVYWELDGVRQCIAIDQYYRVADNLAAIAATFEAMRAIERHGGAEILNRAFKGFAALPQTTDKPWRDVLGFRSTDHPPIEIVDARFRDLARTAHPDTGSSEAAMQELNRARNEAGTELGVK